VLKSRELNINYKNLRMKNIVVLGSTGSVGRRALDVIKLLGVSSLWGIVARSNWRLLIEQIQKYKPKIVGVVKEDAYKKVKDKISKKVEVLCGQEGVDEIISSSKVDIVISAISGAAALPYNLSVLRSGKILATANKESFVMAGGILMDYSKRYGAKIIPCDSEHSAIFQIIENVKHSEIKKVFLTASGGPFINYTKAQMAKVKIEDALKHPIWKMGKKITVDSATMMNKAFEIIEARWLFGLSPKKIKVVLHPQSVIHSYVEFCDGSCIAEMNYPDMCLPIQYAITYPERLDGKWREMDITKVGKLTFAKPGKRELEALKLGYEVAEKDGTSGAILNAADEVAVDFFLEGKIKFLDIVKIVKEVLKKGGETATGNSPTLTDIMETDKKARDITKKYISHKLN